MVNSSIRLILNRFCMEQIQLSLHNGLSLRKPRHFLCSELCESIFKLLPHIDGPNWRLYLLPKLLCLQSLLWIHGRESNLRQLAHIRPCRWFFFAFFAKDDNDSSWLNPICDKRILLLASIIRFLFKRSFHLKCYHCVLHSGGYDQLQWLTDRPWSYRSASKWSNSDTSSPII